jgi:hypothetical protein
MLLDTPPGSTQYQKLTPEKLDEFETRITVFNRCLWNMARALLLDRMFSFGGWSILAWLGRPDFELRNGFKMEDCQDLAS